jgi:methanogenic corrinoid protein MtbC1
MEECIENVFNFSCLYVERHNVKHHAGREIVGKLERGEGERLSQENLKRLKEAVVKQELNVATEATAACLRAGASPKEVIDAVSETLKVVGDLFECGELFLPEVMRAANVAKASLNMVLPLIGKGGAARGPSKGRIAIGSLGPHDIGKTIVASMLIADGFDIADMGINLNPEKAERFLQENTVDILALSVLLTSDVDKAAEVIRRTKRLKGSLKIMVGGVAMNEAVAKRIGSDAYGRDAMEGVGIAREFMGVKK